MSSPHPPVTGDEPARARVIKLDPLSTRMRRHQPHALHRGEHVWQETNASVDMWIELLHGRGHDPRAALGPTVMQDFEGDQFTPVAFAREDLEALFGLRVQPLALHDSLETHVGTQTRRANIVLIEADAFHLPESHPAAYRREHLKTTIAVDHLAHDSRRLGYFDHAGYHALDGEDYDAVLHRTEPPGPDADFAPHAELVKRVHAPLRGTALADAAADALCAHLLRRPEHNPVTQWRAAFPAHLDTLLDRDDTYFRRYAADVTQQLGANFELMAQYLRWMRKHGFDIPLAIPAAAHRIASEAMVLQCRLARSLSRKRRDLCDECFDTLEEAYDEVVPVLSRLVC